MVVSITFGSLSSKQIAVLDAALRNYKLTINNRSQVEQTLNPELLSYLEIINELIARLATSIAKAKIRAIKPDKTNVSKSTVAEAYKHINFK